MRESGRPAEEFEQTDDPPQAVVARAFGREFPVAGTRDACRWDETQAGQAVSG
jgi:hypothetical protein